MLQCGNKTQAHKEMTTMALNEGIPMPGDHAFPLNSMYKAPKDNNEKGDKTSTEI